MNGRYIGIACATVMFCCSAQGQQAASHPAPLGSGIDIQYIDSTIRVQDDFYGHVNGKWLANTVIPPDRGRYMSIDILNDRVQGQLREIVDGLQKSTDPADPDQRKIAALYASFMDEAGLAGLGLKPLHAEFARIDALRDKTQIPSLIAHLNRIGVTAPYSPQVHQDAKAPTRYAFDLGQDGLGLPDRDYYLQADAKLEQIRATYEKHVQTMLALAGDSQSAVNAKNILALESSLAKAQWTEVESRDPAKTYNKLSFAALSELAPGYNWKSYLSEAGVAGRTHYLIISEPGYLAAFNKILAEVPLPVWKSYFRWHLLSDFASYLSKPFVAEHFAFYGTALRGVTSDKPRWRLGVELVDRSIGEGLGRIYVARYFPPEAKARIDALVHNLLVEYRTEIDTLDWMSPETKIKAKEKLAKYSTVIGYPAKWRDYGALSISRTDLVGNVIRANSFEYDRNLAKLGHPIDRSEWDMTPQTINAQYRAELNEIVFPAAVLQPPFFNPQADDAVNYGSAGFVIGHEISHGFDDGGSQYDGDGMLLSPPGWFTQTDLDQYKARTHRLVEQYSAFSPVPGYPVNGELTLGENIADNAGLAVAFKAYELSLNGKKSPVIDGLTGEQRFFMGAAQSLRGKVRDNEAIMRIKFDPHPPIQLRATVPEMNFTPFYTAFEVKEGDKMYLAPDKRVTIW
jgi:putative endopeptidase